MKKSCLLISRRNFERLVKTRLTSSQDSEIVSNSVPFNNVVDDENIDYGDEATPNDNDISKSASESDLLE